MPQDQYADEVEQVSSLLSLARQTYEAHIQEAKDKASEILLAAEKEVEETLGSSRKELEFLKKQIVLHRDFEIRYRESLKGYLGGLLNEINDVDEFVLEEHQDNASISAFATVDDDEKLSIRLQPSRPKMLSKKFFRLWNPNRLRNPSRLSKRF